MRVLAVLILVIAMAMAMTPYEAMRERYRANDMAGLERAARDVLAAPTHDDAQRSLAYELLGVAQYTLGNLPAATATFRAGVRWFPDHATMWLHLGDCYLGQLKMPQALRAYEVAIVEKRLSNDVIKLFKARNWVANWTDHEHVADHVHAMVLRSLSQGTSISNIVASDCYDLSPAATLAFARLALAVQTSSHQMPLPCDTTASPTQLKLGFVSSDFGLHPIATLVRGLVSYLQRDPRFEVYCFALSDQGSWWRSNITGEVHAMVSLTGMSTLEAAETIRAHGIHVLVDLNGHTLHSGLPILSHRPAPVQVSFLGFPQTTGASFIDYFVVDAIAAPPRMASGFSEKLVYLPLSYIVNDHKQLMLHVTTHAPPLREDAKLPASPFVFATFSNWQKMDPTLFGIWMRVLRRVPSSVLWFMQYPGHEAARDNLVGEAFAQGVDGSRRLVFTALSPWINHTWVKQAADVVLDTTIKNGHTTLVDALWAGVPVVTLEGDRMNNRAGSSATASLHHELHATMTTHSLKEYEDTAVLLAQSHALRRRLRDAVQGHRTQSLLFDTSAFASYFGDAMVATWDRKGERPAHVAVPLATSCAHSTRDTTARTIRALKKRDKAPILLHIGGHTQRDGWQLVNIQHAGAATPDVLSDMQSLHQFASSSVTAIYSSHVLEHVGYGADASFAVATTLAEWFRLLLPGGALYLSVPDLSVLASLLLDPTLTLEEQHFVTRMIYGGQVDAYDYHKAGFTLPILRSYLNDAGFCKVQHVRSFGLFADTSDLVFHGRAISLNVVATACKLGTTAVDVHLPTLQYWTK
ncbi:hypothetical protein SPRG_14136 [Saprolegnia parasitica CBS 223.65]|uniref:Uncharacterized protein n=1 Tax=Saprolegnia parasitica (strain CBS 223.65) TaxID=695850 RepID=A0A067BVN4_SAPPC|nr:hypothetical protein SPRG_14136 [Saprolegnia parasitica CBS 223.65]KDO20905.1 hypothetical protein SPRG_14136 [Saprolegnia parasitica CBS 223.65]|eukprot:XP_012208394.1 hypothetical protein SPRG_14136 [Saprolegnia parasitica CBS 223.65]